MSEYIIKTCQINPWYRSLQINMKSDFCGWSHRESTKLTTENWESLIGDDQYSPFRIKSNIWIWHWSALEIELTVDFVELWTVFYEHCSLLGRSSNMGSLGWPSRTTLIRRNFFNILLILRVILILLCP